MAPRKKKIKDMTADEVRNLTDNEVADRIFGKRLRKKVQKLVGKSEKKSNR